MTYYVCREKQRSNFQIIKIFSLILLQAFTDIHSVWKKYLNILSVLVFTLILQNAAAIHFIRKNVSFSLVLMSQINTL